MATESTHLENLTSAAIVAWITETGIDFKLTIGAMKSWRTSTFIGVHRSADTGSTIFTWKIVASITFR